MQSQDNGAIRSTLYPQELTGLVCNKESEQKIQYFRHSYKLIATRMLDLLGRKMHELTNKTRFWERWSPGILVLHKS